MILHSDAMSTLYNLEPQPTAKVLLKTTAGDLVLELFAKQTPLASRNFLQHCLDGYYDNTVFHRLVPGFIIQGGDPTGLGTGGVSTFDNGAPFADEFHSRLKFNRRGLLGMANSGEPNDNTSQFFLTLDKTPELQGKNTMFGRVEGETIYNMQRMGESELAEEGGDRPLYPYKIIGTEILVNPFEDMVKRVMVAERTKEEDGKPKKKRKAGKTLLSFGADEGEEAGPVIKKAKVNPKFKSTTNGDAAMADTEKATASKPAIPSRKRSVTRSPSPPVALKAKRIPAPVRKAPSSSPSASPEPPQVEKTMTALEKTNAEIAALKASMKRNVAPTQEKSEKKTSALEAMIPSTATRGRKRGKATDESGALDMFNSFKKKLGSAAATETPAKASGATSTSKADASNAAAAAAVDAEESLCDLHFIVNCQSCTSWADDAANQDGDNDDDDANWMSHQLSFAKDTLGKDLEWKRKMAEFEVIDPREKTSDIVSDRRKEKGHGGREWDSSRDKGDKRKA